MKLVICLVPLMSVLSLVNGGGCNVRSDGGRHGPIVLKSNNGVDIACPGNTIKHNDFNKTEVITATCIDGGRFMYENVSYAYEDFTCERDFNFTTKAVGKCSKRKVKFAVGYKLNNTEFRKIYANCFSTLFLQSVYTIVNMSNVVLYEHNNNCTESYEYNILYRDIDKLYENTTQQMIINKILGLPLNSSNYINETNYLIKTSLIPNYIDNCNKHYINSVPIWNKLYEQSWLPLEKALLAYTRSTNNSLVIASGTQGLLRYTHAISDHLMGLLLQAEGISNQLPVPKFLWKFVFDATNITASGIGLILENNFETNRTNLEPEVCKSCKDFQWFAGVERVRCCNFTEFKYFIDNQIPMLELEFLNN